MDKYRPCPSIIAMFTSDSQHPPRSKHAVYLDGLTVLKFWFLSILFAICVCQNSKKFTSDYQAQVSSKYCSKFSNKLRLAGLIGNLISID